MQEKKRKKKKSTAEQEEQTKKIQSVAETASEQPTAKELPKEIESNCFRLRRYKGETANGLDFGRSCNLCCPVGCHAADAAASISG